MNAKYTYKLQIEVDVPAESSDHAVCYALVCLRNEGYSGINIDLLAYRTYLDTEWIWVNIEQSSFDL